MTNPPSISVLIATFNGERYLNEAIDSMLAQTIAPHEIIVVDDGSTDSSADILATYGDAIVVIRQANQGPSAARNAALSSARGRFVALLDSDDVSKPDRLERQQRALQEQPDAVACFCGYWRFDETGWLDERPADPAAGRGDPIEYLSNVVFHYATVPYERLKAPHVRFPVGLSAGEDVVFAAQLAATGPVIAIPEALYGYRSHLDQISRRNRATATSNRYFEDRYSWIRQHHADQWPGYAWTDIEAALWNGLVRQTEAAYWARERSFFLNDRNYLRSHWPHHLPEPDVTRWRWYPDWIWNTKNLADRLAGAVWKDAK